MKKKKEKKWAKKLRKHCHRTPCSECFLYHDRCQISDPVPAYWHIGKAKATIHERVGVLYEEGKSPEEISLLTGTETEEVKRCLMDIRKSRKAAGIRMIEEEE